jgi:hypothetical protein
MPEDPVVANAGSSGGDPSDLDKWLHDLALTDANEDLNPAAAIGRALRAEQRERESALTDEKIRAFGSRLIEGLEAEGLLTPPPARYRRLAERLGIAQDSGMVYGHESRSRFWRPLPVIALIVAAAALAAAILFWAQS